ncbi:HEAT repeat domain-containing protein [Kordia sp. YSTF-M3]|uniref:HEAT repeat domain-containing protein n=1 Tax=Kordia aestuariivivens TaxID=2759037 RepID=A0ABR7QD54_9FLAO|nr:zf-HC2 domain-containing protein [Kordia aestuariivivens]MBC8756491.1 HEAT repeat domain-containing protein [Kordia aestuariivivens]
MEKEHIKDLLVEYLDGLLDTLQKDQVEQHLSECAICAKELEGLKEVMNAFKEQSPEMSPESLRENFHKRLDEELQKYHKVVYISEDKKPKKRTVWKQNIMRIAASIVLLVGGFVIGKYQQTDTTSNEIAVLTKETKSVKQKMAISLIESTSAGKRIQAVNSINQLEELDPDMLQTLANSVLYDNNVNVRLTAVETLQKFIKNQLVQKSFINALQTEKNAGVQIAIIQALANLNEEDIISPMRQLLNDSETEGFVKDQIKKIVPNIT